MNKQLFIFLAIAVIISSCGSPLQRPLHLRRRQQFRTTNTTNRNTSPHRYACLYFSEPTQRDIDRAFTYTEKTFDDI